MLVTPYDIMNKPVEKELTKPKETRKVYNEYSTKFRSAIYGAILFILLSHRVSYKILDIILKLFTSRLDAVDEDENPILVGTIIMAGVIGLIIFLF
jgi:hypothetical protein